MAWKLYEIFIVFICNEKAFRWEVWKSLIIIIKHKTFRMLSKSADGPKQTEHFRIQKAHTHNQVREKFHYQNQLVAIWCKTIYEQYKYYLITLLSSY